MVGMFPVLPWWLFPVIPMVVIPGYPHGGYACYPMVVIPGFISQVVILGLYPRVIPGLYPRVGYSQGGLGVRVNVVVGGSAQRGASYLPLHARNRQRKAQKPATERGSAQGR